ncbi:MAG: mannose-1-phosphate guanylyltransferase [Peptococcaceae bacterium]|nr:mannose-1-phosphate guanylyltransferase [Peptococcaceae bacterium]
MASVVIMAGGRGERFWPRSRMAMPKQFLSLVGDKTMLQQTVERLDGLVDIKDVYIVAGNDFKEIIKYQLPGLPLENIIVEPFGRNTAAAIGLAAAVIGHKNPHDIMIVLPADHYISDLPRFKEIMRSAIEAAAPGDEIITLGITPSRPDTGYGYIRRGEQHDNYSGIASYIVRQFTEKPDLPKAQQFLDEGDYLWNSGMFIWRTDLIRKLIETFTPELAQGLQVIEKAFGSEEYEHILIREYQAFPNISVDYGIMERADRVLVIPSDFGWDDLGSWTALDRYAEKDQHGNAITGTGVMLNSNNTYVYAPGNTIVTIGVQDLIIVHHENGLLICNKDNVQDIRIAVQALKKIDCEDML